MCAAAGELRTVVGLVDWGGADVAAKDKEGCSSLFLASLNGHVEVVEFLLARGAPTEAAVQTHATAPGTALHAGTSCVNIESYCRDRDPYTAISERFRILRDSLLAVVLCRAAFLKTSVIGR